MVRAALGAGSSERLVRTARARTGRAPRSAARRARKERGWIWSSTARRSSSPGPEQGIGLATVRAFVDAGARVVAGSREVTEALAQLAARGSVSAVAVDLSTADGPAGLVANAGSRIDVVVNNVGMAPTRSDGFLAVTDEMWHTTWNLNLMAAVRTVRAALPLMLSGGGGVIVNVGSVNARLPDPSVIDYSASKAALVNVAKSLSKEFGGRGIRVNTVDPGPVATDLWLGADGVAARVGRASGRSPQDVAAAAATAMVTGRFTRAEEVAELVVFLASGPRGEHHGRRCGDRRRNAHHALSRMGRLAGQDRSPSAVAAQRCGFVSRVRDTSSACTRPSCTAGGAVTALTLQSSAVRSRLPGNADKW